jgi:hypothetical protein
MKTTIDIPDKDLKGLLKNTNANTKREAVLTAIRDYNSRMRRKALAEKLGTFENFMTSDELKTLRGEPE